MGTLFLPSLLEKKFIKINNVTLEEATEFIKDFTKRVIDGHNIKPIGSATVEPILYNGFINDYESLDLQGKEEMTEKIATAIRIANTVGTRGARAVFVDEYGDFAIGTTVVYNRNWATVKFDDPTILDLLRSAGIELTIEEDTESLAFWY